MNIIICGQGYFAIEVLKKVTASGHKVTSVFTDYSQKDLIHRAEDVGSNVHLEPITAAKVDDGTDLILSVHCFDFISEKARLRSRHGAIGYHPSLLPLHKGRSSIEWCIKLGERVTGGTAFRLSNDIDGGDILSQEHVIVSPKDTVTTLWRDKLQPLGVKLICEAVESISKDGALSGREQDARDATWFPSMERPPVKRPDLYLIEYKKGS